MRSVVWRLVGAGALAALTAAVAGRVLERARYGSNDEDALARVEAELRRRFDASAETLRTIASRVVANPDIIAAAARDSAGAGRLFAVVSAAVPEEQAGRTGVTIYDAAGNVPLAWAGRASDLPKERINGPAALVVAPGALGPRLIRIDPVFDRRRPPSREATIVVEQSLAGIQSTPALGDTFVVSTALAPVRIHAQMTGSRQSPPVNLPSTAGGAARDNDDLRSSWRPDTDDYVFTIPSQSGALLVEADVARADLSAARERWRSRTRAVVVSILALTVLLCAGRLLDVRRRSAGVGPFLGVTAALVAALIAARLMLGFAATWLFGSDLPTSPAQLLLSALAAAALVAVAADIVERRRVTRPWPRIVTSSGHHLHARIRLGVAYLVAGLLDAWLLAGYERLLQRVVSATALDVLHFSLHPISAPRLSVAFGLLLLHAAVIWTAALVIRAAGLLGRVPRRLSATAAIALLWLAGAWLGLLLATTAMPDVAVPPILTALTAAAACAAALATLRVRARRASQAVHIVALFLALLVPALAMYPSLVGFATDAKERLIAGEYGPLALSQREELKTRLKDALDEIDAMRSLASFIVDSSGAARPTDRASAAFAIWSATDLAKYRVMSAIELYAADGRLVSRFALNLPEYAAGRVQASGCEWGLFDEPSPFGSSVRHVLTASRGLCDGGAPMGAIVVRVMLDYTTLPFISSQSPYLESLRPKQQPPAEGVQGRDVEFAVYGWSRVPIYASGTSVWPLPESVFDRTVESRAPFWTTVTRDQQDQVFRVYFLNDRGGIYALGYPVITWFGHLVNLAELVVLAGVLYVLLLLGATVFSAVVSQTPTTGRALVRELRSSFYWKVFLASLAGAILPVVILAIAIDTYFARQFRDGVDEAAAKTATVAQRLVEDYASLQPRGGGALSTIDDPIMVLVSRAIDQDVNLFDRTELQATSQRDLFASGLLSNRTPGAVYERIILERQPTFVGIEQVGDFSSYLVAAAPVRAGGREGIVTVPLPLRQQEIERQIDELDRQVVFAAVLFSLLGAAIGYWMAERIADPVNRLSRATRRIARGDLDARIASASADELGRLVQDFNQMAEDLKRQRADLERTQRLEAWADMARQVAHDIKNPLTPIQLSAEHARRVNVDRGRPLSPVLDECVNAILVQVTLLRQIAAEFSSFASSPTARPERTALAELLEEVVSPYRTGLGGRIDIEVIAAADLPPVSIDRTLFARALTNVIENALHAMPGHGRLRIVARRESSDVVIEITDTGVGMDPDAVDRIFEPYFSTKATGTGLGLTIAKRNIELNGGSIVVRSQRGVGTTVTISVPVA
jgi:signal transduction histidine kinase